MSATSPAASGAAIDVPAIALRAAFGLGEYKLATGWSHWHPVYVLCIWKEDQIYVFGAV